MTATGFSPSKDLKQLPRPEFLEEMIHTDELEGIDSQAPRPLDVSLHVIDKKRLMRTDSSAAQRGSINAWIGFHGSHFV